MPSRCSSFIDRGSQMPVSTLCTWTSYCFQQLPTLFQFSPFTRHLLLIKTTRLSLSLSHGQNKADCTQRNLKLIMSPIISSVPYGDWLGAERSGDRIPVGSRFFLPVQFGSEAHPATCTMGTGSFPGVKRSGDGVDRPPHLAPRLKKE